MGEPPALADDHDALLVDLDGTLVLAGEPIPHAADSLRHLMARGLRTVVVTNNASRSPAAVADHLTALGIAFAPDDVISSPLAAARMLARTHTPGDPVLVVGADALADAVTDVGLVAVGSADEDPVAVVQGHSPDTGWRLLAEACVALRAGADWVATNVDSTLPTDRGLLPGNGAMVAALVTATGRRPRVAGKPARPLLDVAVERVGAHRPLVVGDRLDTDIAAAVSAGMPSLMVLTGVSGASDLLMAPPDRRPSAIADDLRGLLDPTRCARLDGTACGDRASAWRVTVADDRLELRAAGDGTPLAALALLVERAWSAGLTDVCAGDDAAAAVLSRWGLA